MNSTATKPAPYSNYRALVAEMDDTNLHAAWQHVTEQHADEIARGVTNAARTTEVEIVGAEMARRSHGFSSSDLLDLARAAEFMAYYSSASERDGRCSAYLIDLGRKCRAASGQKVPA